MAIPFRTGAGRLSLDFIRTLRFRGTPEAVEELSDAQAVAAWVRLCGPVSAADASAADVVTAQRLREAVYGLIVAARDGRLAEYPRATRDRVNRAAAQPVPVPVLDTAGRLSWRADEPVAATLALVARDALDLVTSPALGRVRACAGHDCQALFLDTSRPGTRRWCSMDACGNRAKKETLRAKAQ
jgi:predicted RNA-binding Zn ribbon-like protein